MFPLIIVHSIVDRSDTQVGMSYNLLNSLNAGNFNDGSSNLDPEAVCPRVFFKGFKSHFQDLIKVVV